MYDKLKAYEDLGFTPEEIAYMAKFFKEHTSAEAIAADMKIVAKLIELEKPKTRLFLDNVEVTADDLNRKMNELKDGEVIELMCIGENGDLYFEDSVYGIYY